MAEINATSSNPGANPSGYGRNRVEYTPRNDYWTPDDSSALEDLARNGDEVIINAQNLRFVRPGDAARISKSGAKVINVEENLKSFLQEYTGFGIKVNFEEPGQKFDGSG